MTTERKPFAERCNDECTRDVIFLFQRRRFVTTALPDGFEAAEGHVTQTHDRCGNKLDTPIDWTSEELHRDGICTMVNGWEVPAAFETWDTEAVYLTREEGERHGRTRAYRYADGWRVYGVCAEGELAELIKST
jgi:hypothetical protein